MVSPGEGADCMHNQKDELILRLETLWAGTGNRGVGFAAGKLPVERYERAIVLDLEVRVALGIAVVLFTGEEPEKPVQRLMCSERQIVFGEVGSGIAGMNPSVLSVEVRPFEPGRCKAIVSGASKEGIVKQHSAKKAVESIINILEGVARAEG